MSRNKENNLQYVIPSSLSWLLLHLLCSKVEVLIVAFARHLFKTLTKVSKHNMIKFIIFPVLIPLAFGCLMKTGAGDNKIHCLYDDKVVFWVAIQ